MIPRLLQFARDHIPARLEPAGTKALDRAEHILLGSDDSAQSQRMALMVFMIRVASAVIALLSQVLLARWMGSFDYGIFVAVWTAVIIIDTLISFGAPSAGLRFVAKYREEKRFGLVWGVVIGSMGLATLTSTFLALLSIVVFSLYPQLLGPDYSTPAFILMLAIPVMVVVGVGEAISRSFNWVSIAFVPAYIYRPLLILALVFIGAEYGFGATAVTAAVATLVACHAIGLVQLGVMATKIRKAVPVVKPSFKLKYWLMVAVPVFLVESFYVLLTSVDVVFVGWLTSPEETAVYFASTKILALVHFVYFAVRAASAHRYSAYHAAGDHAGLAGFIRQSISWTFWPSLFLGVMMILLGKYFLWLFGEEYMSGAPILGILVAGLVIRSSVGPAESLLVMTGNQNACAFIYVFALFVNVVLNLSLIPAMGLAGAAIATACAMAFESVALYTIIKRKLGVHAFIFAPSTEPDDTSREAI
ncbi:MAG: lipopolysaccharide biosynthesis protein [Pseudomonadota bacterium]